MLADLIQRSCILQKFGVGDLRVAVEFPGVAKMRVDGVVKFGPARERFDCARFCDFLGLLWAGGFDDG